MFNIPIFILVRIEYWWLVSLNEIIFFFIFLFESTVFVYKCINALKRYFNTCPRITCSLCNRTNWNINRRKYVMLSFFSPYFKIWIDTERVIMFSFSIGSKSCNGLFIIFFVSSLMTNTMWNYSKHERFL